MLLCKEMQSVKSFCLGLSDSRDIRRPRQAPVAGKGPPRILNDQSLRSRFGAGLVVKQWLQRVLLASSTETVILVREGLFAELNHNLLLARPGFRQSLDKIWSRPGQLVIDGPGAGQLAFATLSSCLKTGQCNHVADIRVEDLFVSSVGGCTDLVGIYDGTQIFNVSQHDIGWFAIILVVLTRSDWADVRRNSSVNDDVLFAIMLFEWQTSKNLEAASVVNFVRNLAKIGVQARQREGVLVDKAKRLVQSFDKVRVSPTLQRERD